MIHPKYRIQNRKYSSNIIEFLIGEDKQGKPIYKSYIAPLINKTEGDELVNNLFIYLNSNK